MSQNRMDEKQRINLKICLMLWKAPCFYFYCSYMDDLNCADVEIVCDHQQERERGDNCRQMEQGQAGWERLWEKRVKAIQVWDTKRPKLGEKLQGWRLWRTRSSRSPASKAWQGKNDSPAFRKARTELCRELPTSLCHSPASGRTIQYSCPPHGQLKDRHLEGGFKGFILRLSEWVTGLLWGWYGYVRFRVLGVKVMKWRRLIVMSLPH